MSIGAGEILLLAILGLILFGPQRLPEIARQVGRALAEVRRVSREFEREVREATEPFAKEVREAEAEARTTYALDENHSSFVTPSKPAPPDEDPPPPKDVPAG